MTKKQQEQFNRMLYTLRKIAKEYQSTDSLKRHSQRQYGLDYDEALEYAYENIQGEAKAAIKGIKFIEDRAQLAAQEGGAG